MFSYLNINYILASTIGFISGIFISYPLNIKWSFSDISTHKKVSSSIYILVYLTSLIINAILLYSFVSILNINVLLSNFMCLFITTVTNFLGIKYLSFYSEYSFFHRVKLLLSQIIKQPLFYLVLIIKISLIIWGSDTYFKNTIQLIPEAINSGNYYYQVFSSSLDFAYPYLLVYMVKTVGEIFFFLPNIPTYKILIFIADFIILLVFLSWFRTYIKRVLVLYWLSPVILYGSYYLGYIDIIAIMFIFVSLFLLFKDKIIWSFIVFSIAGCIKIPILLLLPFFMIYALFSGVSYKKVALIPIILITTFIIVNINYITDYYFLYTVLLDQSKTLILVPSLDYTQNLFLYIVPAIYMILIIFAYNLQIRSRELLVIFMGFTFATILIFINPNPSWYIWFIPFLIYLYIDVAYKEKKFLIVFQIFFVLYFIVFNNYSSSRLWFYIPFNEEKIQNLVFTILQVFFVMNLIIIYKNGIMKTVSKKLISKRFYLGIGGDSGSGKSTLSSLMEKLFNQKNTFAIHGDDNHKWERGDAKWQNFTHLDPKANDLNKELAFVLSLDEDKFLSRKHYDHNSGKFIKRKINNLSSRLIIYEGLHTFFLKRLRDFFDAKIFVNPDQDLQLHWKVLRDFKKRGYTKEQVLEQISKRSADSEKYIKSQERFADIIVKFRPTKPIINIGNENEKVDIYLELTILNIIQLDSFLDEISQKGSLSVESLYEQDHYIVSITGSISSDEINDLANKLPLSIVGINNPQFESDYNGLLQIIVLYYILEVANVIK